MAVVSKVWLQVIFVLLSVASSDDNPHHHHHHHHHHRHHHNQSGSEVQVVPNKTGVEAAPHQAAPHQAAAHQAAAHRAQEVPPQRHVHMVAKPQVDAHAQEVVVSKEAGLAPKAAAQVASDDQLVQKMKVLEKELDAKEKAVSVLAKGHLNVNGPLPGDFSDRFIAGVADATGCRQADVQLLGAVPVPEAQGPVEEILFQSHQDVVAAVENQASDPESKLANGVLHSFLVARDEPDEEASDSAEHATATAPEVDMAMPYGDLEPFGREDTAQELTESSIRESNAMVDQLERAEVAEEKRAVFRALTRLRGAAITSYDGIARSATGNIDEYARTNQWRKAHPVHHLANEEADVSRWAFPDQAED